MAALYLLLTLGVVALTNDLTLHTMKYTLGDITYTVLSSLIESPLTTIPVVVTIVGFVFFTDTHSVLYRIIMGGLHGVAHVLAAFTIALLCVHLVTDNLSAKTWILTIPLGEGAFHPDLRMLLAALIILVGGYVAGSFIMGLYLLISFNFFGRHGNEAFSSLGIEDWKNFLRLQIDESGNLLIHPIGIRRVPRKWINRSGDSGPELVPDPNDKRATVPVLIEPPIFMRKAATETGVHREDLNQP
jgi:hypothetical protein